MSCPIEGLTLSFADGVDSILRDEVGEFFPDHWIFYELVDVEEIAHIYYFNCIHVNL